MAKTAMKSYLLAEMKDKYIGKVGNANRDEYEYELRMDFLGQMIKTARQERKLTQEQSGDAQHRICKSRSFNEFPDFANTQQSWQKIILR